MDCKLLKEKMQECLKNEDETRECNNIIHSWNMECKKNDERTWNEFVFGKKEEPKEESKEESKEEPKEEPKEEQ